MEAAGELGDETAKAALRETAEPALRETAKPPLREPSKAARGRLSYGVFDWLALQSICYMFGDRLVDGIGLFRRDVLGDLWIVADVVFNEF